MKSRKLILYLLFLIIPSFVFSQTENKLFLENFEKGTNAMIAEKIDSSIYYYEKAYNWIQKNKYYDSSVKVTQLYSHLGRCYRLVAKPQLSHDLLTKALANARKYKHNKDIKTILLRLNFLHKEIANNNWTFNYTAPKETKTTEAYFQIKSITPIPNTDSLELLINAGTFDGIRNDSQECRVNSRIIKEDSLYHTGIKTFTMTSFYKVENNRSYVHISSSFNNKVLVGDFVTAEVEIPIEWNNLILQEPLLNNDIFTINKDEYFSYRFFYYYGNEVLENETLLVMLNDIKEAANSLAKDSLPGGSFTEKNTKGIFTGNNLIKSLLESTQQHIKLFFEYENSIPGDNMGHNESFVSSYAVWILSGTNFTPSSVKPYLLSIQNKEERIKQINNLYNQIKKKELLDVWVSETLQDIRDENYNNAKQNALLLKDISSTIIDSVYNGWAEYLLANIAHSNGNFAEASNYLNEASNLFNKYNNYEGKTWILSTEANWKKNTDIHVQMQDGHTLHYITTFSPNAKYFATGGSDYLIKIWNKQSGKEIHTISYHTDKVINLQYSPNGKYLVSVGADKKIAVWNAFNYELITSFTSEGETQVAKFSPNSKQLYLAEDSVLYVIKLFSDSLTIEKKITLHRGTINDFVFFQNNPNIIYTCSDDSTFRKWDLAKMSKRSEYSLGSKVKSIIISNNNRYISMVTEDSTVRVFDLYTNNFTLTKNVYLEASFYTTKNASMYAVHSFSTDSKVLAIPIAVDSFRICNLSDSYSRKYYFNTNKYILRSTLFMPDGKDLLLTSSSYDFGLMNVRNYDFEKNSALTTNRISFYANQINKVQYSYDDNTIHYLITEGNYGKINLASGSLFINYTASINFPKGETLCFNKDNLFPVKANSKSNTLGIFDNEKDSFVHAIYLDTLENISSIVKTKNNNYLFVSGINGQIIGYNLNTSSQIFNTHLKTEEVAYGMRLFYDEYNDRIYCKTNQEYVLILNTQTGGVTDTIFVDKARYVTPTKEKIFITTGDGKLKIFDTKTFKYITGWRLNRAEEESLEMCYITTKNQILIQDSEKGIALFDIALDSFLYQFSLNYNCRDIAVNNSETEFALAGADGTIRLYDLSTGKIKANIFLPFKKDPFITDTLNHYYAAKNALNAINISYNNQMYPYDQFDIKLNRPDIIFKTIGRTDSSIINNYHTAYLKRLKSLGINQKQLEITNKLQLPHIKLLNRYTLESTTSDSLYTFDVSFSDDNYNLQTIQVLVNNSPMYGVFGKNISSQNVKSYSTTITVPLAYGNNNIKVYCTNVVGITSFKETFNVYSTYESNVHKPTIYFVGIGIAKYKDSLYNLTYSAKDIRDLASDVRKYFKDVVIDTLLNENVTKENIMNLRNKLLKTTPDDRIIVAITGHGLLSDSLDFYYATYDINFTKPEKRGLKYEMIEKLLDDVPAQEKIMFIDACHSGAIDKDELLALEKNNRTKVKAKTEEQTNVTGIASRSSIKITNKKSKVNANSSFELMQQTFSDLSGSNGAVIISAAGGMEYAFESAEWNNGVFTMAIREGIFLKYADEYYGGNKDGKVSIEELVKYINTRVSTLTNEKQKPTVRRENIDFNWIIRY